MYIEPQPTSIYLHKAMAAVESPKALLRRPPALLNHSSSSSLRGMERTAPSFQTFVKKTPPIGQEKPLPPVPILDRPPSPPLDSGRTSSVYSRTLSQWGATPESWKSRDLASSGVFLQPSIYSISTPELVVDNGETQQVITTLLQPRSYQPLLSSPSPSPSPSLAATPLTELSAASSEYLYRERIPSTLLPPVGYATSPSALHVDKMSLSKARAAQNAPGATYRSSGEMWAVEAEKTRKGVLHRSRSFDTIGALNISRLSPPMPISPLDHGYWLGEGSADSPIQSIIQPRPWAQPSLIKFKLRDSKLSDKYFGMDPIVRAAAAPIAMQQPLIPLTILDTHSLERQSSIDEPDYENRGRFLSPLSAYSRNSIYYQTDQQDQPLLDNEMGNASVMSEADRLAKEYHDLLPTQDFQPKEEDQTSLNGRDVKLAPQPLFFNPRQVSKQRMEQYNRQKNVGATTSSSTNRRLERESPANRWHNDSRTPVFPLKLSLTPDSTRSRSTSGSIPISPPLGTSRTAESSRKKASILPSVLSSGSKKQRNRSVDNTGGHLLSYTGTGSYSTEHLRSGGKQSPAMSPPFLSPGATVVATRAEAEAAFNSPPILVKESTFGPLSAHSAKTAVDSHPKQHDLPLVPKSNHKHKTSDSSGASSHPTVKNPLAQIGERMASFSSVFHRSSVKAPGLAHLNPQFALNAGDGPRTPKLSISPPMIQNISKPLPILDESKGMLKEPTSLREQKRPSIFAHVVDKRRESKAIKRREELKKSIRLIPESVVEGPGLQRDGRGGAHTWL